MTHSAAGAASVIACEWNPNALQALRKNLELNGMAGRCQILEGDSCLTAPRVRLHNLFLPSILSVVLPAALPADVVTPIWMQRGGRRILTTVLSQI